MCELASAIGTVFLRSVDVFVAGSVGALVVLLVTGDCVEHIWWFRPSGTTEVVWWVGRQVEKRSRARGWAVRSLPRGRQSKSTERSPSP